MSRLLLSFLLLAGSFTAASAAEAPRDPSQHFFDAFLGDFSEELHTAKDHGKTGILVMFEMDDCPFCHRMKTTILNQPKVQRYFKKHFLVYAVDIEGDLEITDFQGRATTMKDFAFKQHRVRATPVFAFFDLGGKLIRRAKFIGATADLDEFMLLGRYVVERAFEKESFTRYKRAKRAPTAASDS